VISDQMVSGDCDRQDEVQNGTRAHQAQEPPINTTTPGAFATPGRASGLPVVHQVELISQNFYRGGPALPQAAIVDDVEVVDENQQTIHATVITDAAPVRPMYQQKRCWIGGVMIAGLIITIIILAMRSTGETGSVDADVKLSGSEDTNDSSRSVMPSICAPSQHPSPAPTSIKDVEKQVLIYFYNATGGNAWVESTEWVTDSNICQWRGVECETVGETTFVEELRLPDNNLIGDLEAISLSLINLKYLRILDLDSNLLTGNMTVISTNLAQLSGLTKVDIRLNDITGTVSLDLCESKFISE